MRKLFAVILILVLMPFAVAEKTNRRGVVEFLELYMNRLTKEMCKKNLDVDLLMIPYALSVSDTIILSSSAGQIYVSKDDMTISQINITYFDLNQTEDDAISKEIYNYIAAVSALEYDAMDDSRLKLFSKYGGVSNNAMDETVRILDKEFDISSTTLANAKKTGEEIKVYSGNYDYYIQYWESEASEKAKVDKYRQYDLIAYARE